MPPTRAFAQLNLRWNPFSEPPLEARAELAVEIPTLELARGQALLLLGERGRGKTTRLIKWRESTPHAPYLYLPEVGRHPRIPRVERIFLDEAQRLPRLTRRFVWRRAGAWVIASHEDHSRELERSGFSVRTERLEGLSLKKLEAVIQARLAWARRADGAAPSVPTALLSKLLERYADDLSGIESELYDYYQLLSHSSLVATPSS